MTRKVEVTPYNPQWHAMFAAEAAQLRTIFGNEIIAIHHFGSTSIPHIAAKPIIDLLVEVRDIERIDAFNARMEQRGYLPQGEFGIPHRRFFIKGSEEARTHHIHCFQTGDPEIVRHLDFRDYLRAHPEKARAYSELKERLAASFPENMERYIEGKDPFIKAIDEEAKAWCAHQNC